MHDKATEVRLDISEKSIDKQWDVLDEIRTSLTEIKISLVKIEADQAKTKDLESRVKSLENWRNYLLGAWGATVLLTCCIWAYIKNNPWKH